MDQPPTSQLMHDLMQHSSETRGCVVSVTTKNGDRYSGIFSKFELVSSEQCCIWLIYTQKLDSTSQKANERSDYPYCDNMKIPCDQLSHMEVCFVCSWWLAGLIYLMLCFVSLFLG